MYYSVIKKKDIADGPGVRVSLFVSGCPHKCKGCFNADTWDYEYGQPFTEDTIDEVIEALSPNYIRGLTLLGGEPMVQVNQAGLLPLLRKVNEIYPDKDIWCYSGYVFDKYVVPVMLKEWPETEEFLSYIDVLVDGPFILEQKDWSLKFRGSANQRVIDVQESLKKGEVIIVEDYR
ncbi:MAG: anaerobic ribonucleoside-triphosphate reductase activating protein [Lachnospiraceae bacterium]|nr:anaerobic ribonucleoside-triphosphate reductase activating protein [Lachnospiraceae bacterium]